MYDPSITGLERKIRTAETSYQFKDANELFNCIKNLRPKKIYFSRNVFSNAEKGAPTGEISAKINGKRYTYDGAKFYNEHRPVSKKLSKLLENTFGFCEIKIFIILNDFDFFEIWIDKLGKTGILCYGKGVNNKCIPHALKGFKMFNKGSCRITNPVVESEKILSLKEAIKEILLQ